MIPEVVVDASVALKLIVDEPDSDRAEALLDAHLSQVTMLVAPSHLIGEVGNGLRKLVARRQLDGQEAVTALADLVDLEIVLLDSIDVWPRTLESALDWQLTTYDALYVLTALDRGAELITADERLYTCCSARGLPVRLLG